MGKMARRAEIFWHVTGWIEWITSSKPEMTILFMLSLDLMCFVADNEAVQLIFVQLKTEAWTQAVYGCIILITDSKYLVSCFCSWFYLLIKKQTYNFYISKLKVWGLSD